MGADEERSLLVHIIEEVESMLSGLPTSIEEDERILYHLQDPQQTSHALSIDERQLRLDRDDGGLCALINGACAMLDRKNLCHMVLAVQYRLKRKSLLKQVCQSLEGQLQLICTRQN